MAFIAAGKQSAVLSPQSAICRLSAAEGTSKYFTNKHALTNGSVQRNY
ncbi:hypothetical protein KsCSTR_09370 [Candidatus Kuenenia stuttgartiensis]|uniref:Uncharacterized protein n=1 Tax=Kuenenia stuttgartiensis TaxID=174633 RepID=A0A6G7GL90_KUEST|nr:hypothetical protein KsCSTR_09370 [Candidatus Kuenenia stuttgartiensis]